MANITKVVVGKRQILRELKKDNIVEIRIAVDAEVEYMAELIEAAKFHKINYRIHSTMNQIADEYGIEVPSGAIGVLKE